MAEEIKRCGKDYLLLKENELTESYSFLLPEKLTWRKYDHGTHGIKEVTADKNGLEQQALLFVAGLMGEIEGANCFFDREYMTLYFAIHDFIESGTANDAFDIFYWVICHVLGADYNETRHIIEMLSHYESRAAGLVTKHRDHYVHSVYVFLLGLAVYESNPGFQEIYSCYLKRERVGVTKEDQRERFLHFWSITALFHDVGYVYEIPFEQVKAYGEKAGGCNPMYVSFRRAKYWDSMRFRKNRVTKMERLALVDGHLGEKSRSLDKVLVYHMERIFSDSRDFDRKDVLDKLKRKASHPEEYSMYMDHAYFSAKIVFDLLLGKGTKTRLFGTETHLYMDVLTAIMIHNGIFKRIINLEKKPLDCREHPLAFLLMLCDELQIWNRTSYGKDSRGEVHANDAAFIFSEEGITAAYRFDEEYEDVFEGYLKESDATKLPRTLSKFNMKKERCDFLKDIEEVVAVNSLSDFKLKIEDPEFGGYDRFRDEGISDTHLLYLYDMATRFYELERSSDRKGIPFDKQPMLSRLSYIGRAKSINRYLSRIGYFYTEQEMGLHRVKEDDHFSIDEERRICGMEERRLAREKQRYCYDKPILLPFQPSRRLEGYDGVRQADQPDKMAEFFRNYYEKIRQEETYRNTADDIIKVVNSIDGLKLYRLHTQKEYVALAAWDKSGGLIILRMYHRNMCGQIDRVLADDEWCLYYNDYDEKYVSLLGREDQDDDVLCDGRIFLKIYFYDIPEAEEKNTYRAGDEIYEIDGDGGLRYTKDGVEHFWTEELTYFVDGGSLYIGVEAGCLDPEDILWVSVDDIEKYYSTDTDEKGTGIKGTDLRIEDVENYIWAKGGE